MAYTAKDVKALRDATNAGMMDCKRALTEKDGDFDKAVVWLREKGMAAAAKRADRAADQGVVSHAAGEGVVPVVAGDAVGDQVAGGVEIEIPRQYEVLDITGPGGVLCRVGLPLVEEHLEIGVVDRHEPVIRELLRTCLGIDVQADAIPYLRQPSQYLAVVQCRCPGFVICHVNAGHGA